MIQHCVSCSYIGQSVGFSEQQHTLCPSRTRMNVASGGFSYQETFGMVWCYYADRHFLFTAWLARSTSG